MPIITIQFDDTKVSKEEITSLSEATQRIVSSVTKIEDVFVYTNSAQVKVKIAPIEIFVQMTASKIKDLDQLTIEIKDSLKEWKEKQKFAHPINLTVIPMAWKVEIGI